MSLIINSRGKLQEITYTNYERLMLALKAAKRRNEKLIDMLAKERETPRETSSEI